MPSGLFRLIHGSKMRASDGFPGPAPSFPFGNSLDFAGKPPWEVCARYAREYGGATRIWLGGRPALVLNDPKLIGEVLDTRADDFPDSAEGKAKREAHPLRMDGQREWLESQVEPMRAMLREGIRLLKDLPEPVDVAQTVQHLGFDAFSVAVWGHVLGADVYEWFLTLAMTGDRSTGVALTAPLFPPMNPWFYSARRKWRGLFSSLMEKAKEPDQPPRSDLLSVLLRRGWPSSDSFRDALTSIFFRGVFSTFSAVTTSLYLLAHNPVVEQRLRAELGVLVGRDPDYNLETLESCAYLDCVLRETLRLYPPMPLIYRNSAKDRSVVLGGQTLPPNTLLFISNWFLQHDPAHWNDPDRFDPGRWENGGAEQNPFGSGWYFPFGRGPRTCGGQPFAMLAMKLTLAEILIDSRLELDRSLPYRQDYFFGVTTPKGLKGSFRPVSGV
jgi:cytochrome P450